MKNLYCCNIHDIKTKPQESANLLDVHPECIGGRRYAELKGRGRSEPSTSHHMERISDRLADEVGLIFYTLKLCFYKINIFLRTCVVYE